MVKYMAPFLILISTFSLLSCNKSVSGGGNVTDTAYITCNLDGLAKSFDNAAGSDTLNVAGINSIEISGYANNVNKETLHLDISNNYSYPGLPFLTGIYPDTSTRFVLSSYYLLVVNPDSTLQYEAGTGLAGLGDSIANHLNVVITAIEGGYIAGTFSGDYFLGGDPHAAKKTISNGTFYVKLQ